MLARVAAGANGVDTDLTPSPGSYTLPAINGLTPQIDVERRSNRLGQHQRRPRWGILLMPVMRFDDLHVVPPERAHEGREGCRDRGDPQTHVACVEDGNLLRCLDQFVQLPV